MQQPKTGGRKKGTPNKRTQALLDAIGDVCPDYDPVVSMAIIANDVTQELSIRVQCHKEVAQYVHPKRKALEVDMQGSMDIGVREVNVSGASTKDS